MALRLCYLLTAINVALFLFLETASSKDYDYKVIGPARVIDGDTLEIDGKSIRLEGIDAPEARQTCQTAEGVPWACGIAATLAMENMIAGDPVKCFVFGMDRYERLLATCHVWPRVNLNASMMWDGWAVAYRKHSTFYVKHEAYARKERLGVWSGKFDMPWDWRRARRPAAPKKDNPV